MERQAPGRPVGWAWLSGRTNSLTGARYGNFRSLAVADVDGRSDIGEMLLAAVLQAADGAGMRQLTGKVHARNLGMRALYRKFGFEATHVTMEKRVPGPGAGGQGDGGEGAQGRSMIVKCVIWDLDNTLLSGIYLESPTWPPAADPGHAAAATTLRDRGIIHAVAEPNPPEAAAYAARVTRAGFAAADCGWGRKSDAVRRIVADLDIAADAVAFVDDDLFERAEVSFAVPEALVLSPEDMADAVAWPEFSPGPVTAEARRRGEMYAQRRLRLQEARSFAGSRDEFLRYCGTEVTIEPATAADVPRLRELSVRPTSSTRPGRPCPRPSCASWSRPPRTRSPPCGCGTGSVTTAWSAGAWSPAARAATGR